MRYFRYLIFLSYFFICFNCKNDSKNIENSEPISVPKIEKKEAALFQYLEPSETNITFKNEIRETETFNFLLYEYLYNGGGVAVGDVNNDGLDDIYFSGNTVANKLYINQGNFKFKDVTLTANVDGGGGFKTGVTMVDINNDGLLDIYVCKSATSNQALRRNVLYINNGDLTFTDKAKAYGLDDSGYSVQAYFFDSDADNDLDVLVLNHPKNLKEANSIKVSQNKDGTLVPVTPKSYDNLSNRFYVNKGKSFSDVSKTAGVLNDAFSLSAVIGDFNNDFKPDIYICNDYVKPDRLLINKGNNQFEDKLEDYFSHTTFSSMGSDFADINNDGLLDLLTLDMSPQKNERRKMMMMMQNYDKFEKMQNYNYGTQYASNTLNINNGNGRFSDISFVNNVAQTEWSWSVLLADYNNDGLKDIHITNGYKRDITNNDYARYEMDALQKQLKTKQITLKQWIEQIPTQAVPAFLFKNIGDNNFENISESWNSGKPTFSNGAAYSDLNNDGYLDIVVNNINDFPFIMKNKGKETLKNNYLSIAFEHDKTKINDGTTAKIYLSDNTVLTEKYQPTRGFLSSSQHKLHFGIKEGLTVSKLEIIWPDQSMQIADEPQLNQQLLIKRNTSSTYKIEAAQHLFFEDNSSLLGNAFTHTENEFIDFKREALLHQKYSEEGPAVAVADINADGLDDVYLGGANGYAGKLFLQTATGTFALQKTPDFETDKGYEDTDALFFDANGNGYLDLYVVSGGNESKANTQNYKDRLYFNNGKGNFSKINGLLPDIYVSGSVVKVNDIDNDGQLDIFIGGRVTPGRYPETPRSYFLKNSSGKFEVAPNAWNSEIETIGMITDAEFSDLDNDGIKELIIAGEWMPISVFKFENGTFKNKTKDYGLDTKLGWWSSVTIADINNDGYKDIIAGNLGLNSIFKASKVEPTQLYYNDFDNNGSIDPIICTYNNGVSYPLHNRDRLLDHVVMLKKRFTRYEPYANATIFDIFTPQELQNIKTLEANHFEHTLFLNQTGTHFNTQILPANTQISVLNDAVVLDLNKDGKMDMITGGNFYGTDAEYGRYDASIGATLLNKDNSSFEAIAPSKSGLKIDGNVQQIKQITIAGAPHLLIVRNNANASLIKLKN